MTLSSCRMKIHLSCFLAFWIAALVLCSPVLAQDALTIGGGGLYSKFPLVTTTGQLGKYISYASEAVAPPSSHTVSWSIAGTVPTTCTFMVEGSSDAVHWYAISGDDSTPAVSDCTSANSFTIIYKPYLFVRINILTFTAGDGTTALKFLYNRSVT